MTDTITKAKRTISTLSISIGYQTLKNDFAKFEISKITGKQITDACNAIGISNVPLDAEYYSTSWDNYKEIVETGYDIIKNFKWLEDKHDCENRSSEMTQFCSRTALLNTCAQLYCEVKTANGNTFMHWANCVIDSSANLYIVDCDNNCAMQKITSRNFTIGTWTYSLVHIRIG
ncbi:MAG: hypothetical protein WC679_14050 [Bacteroidales bacterium]|jgi:hypothetical protein